MRKHLGYCAEARNIDVVACIRATIFITTVVAVLIVVLIVYTVAAKARKEAIEVRLEDETCCMFISSLPQQLLKRVIFLASTVAIMLWLFVIFWNFSGRKMISFVRIRKALIIRWNDRFLLFHSCAEHFKSSTDFQCNLFDSHVIMSTDSQKMSIFTTTDFGDSK